MEQEQGDADLLGDPDDDERECRYFSSDDEYAEYELSSSQQPGAVPLPEGESRADAVSLVGSPFKKVGHSIDLPRGAPSALAYSLQLTTSVY